MDARPTGVLEGAERVLREGRLSLAEVLGQLRIMQGAADARTWCVLGAVARAAARADVARERFENALGKDPTWEPARSGLRACENGIAAAGGSLVIRSWRRGFWSDVDHVLSSLLAAEVAGRTPIVYWGAESMFTDDGSTDAWRSFFEPVSAARVELLEGDVFPQAWSPVPRTVATDPLRCEPEDRVGPVEIFSRHEPTCVSDLHMGVVSLLPWVREGHALHGLSFQRSTDVVSAYRWLARQHLQPTPRIVERVDALAAELIVPGATLAVHIRGSDKATESPSLSRDIERVVQIAAEKMPRYQRLFLLTDWEPARGMVARAFPGRVVSAPVTRTSSAVGVHYLDAPSRRALGDEVLIDALVAARCDEFVGMASSAVSFAVNFLKEWGEKSTLVGECFQVQPNAFVHLVPKR